MSKDSRYHLAASICFGAAVCIHATGYFTNYLYIIGWLMWIPAIILFVAAVLRIRQDKYIINPYIKRKKIYISTQFILLAVTTAYVVFNIIYNCYILRNGGGELKDGVYWLINLGERIREITQEEYGKLLLAEYRMFTGHILFFYALVVMFYKGRMMENEPV